MKLHDIVKAVIAPLSADFAVHTLDDSATVIASTGDEIALRAVGPQQFSWQTNGGPRLRTPFLSGNSLDAESVLRQWAGAFEPAAAR